MLIDKNSQVHLYIQIAESLRQGIASGAYPAGSVLPTEEELCSKYGVSRYPMRQAMSILVNDGILSRTRGKGTFVNQPKPDETQQVPVADRHNRTIALILPSLKGDFTVDILKGFESAASEKGYAAFFGASGSPDAEISSIERIVQCGAAGIVLFPVNDSTINEQTLNMWIDKGIYISIIDRNPGLDHIDYVGSDNSGGGYMAAYHMKQQGFKNVVFVSDQFHVSSVGERFGGFRRGLQQFDLRLLNEEGLPTANIEQGAIDYSVRSFTQRLDLYRQHLPFAVLTENDYVATVIYTILQGENLIIGEDVGLIGFDNSTAGEYMSPPLTSIAQNGFLIGDTAAKLAIEKIETGSRQSVRHILPTQLVVRRSCGEGRALQ